MRVLITATSLRPTYGGPAFSVSQLAAALGERGADVGLWAADGSALDTELLSPDAGVQRLGGPLRTAAVDFAPDVAHDNGVWLPHNHNVAELAKLTELPRLVSPRACSSLGPSATRRGKRAWPGCSTSIAT